MLSQRNEQTLQVGFPRTAAASHPTSGTPPADQSPAADALAWAQEQLARLQSVSAALSAAITPTDVAAVALAQASAAVGANSGSLAIIDDTAGELVLIAGEGCPAEPTASRRRFSINLPLPMAEAARTGEPLFFVSLADTTEHHPDLAGIRPGTPALASATLPLACGGRVVGVMTLGFTTPQALVYDTAAMLAAIAEQCAQALARALSFEAEEGARRAAEVAVRQRDDLIAMMAHDLKNPLTTIMGRASMLQRIATSERPIDHAALLRGVTAISTAAERMREQIDELLDSTKVQAGQPLTLQREPVDLAALISGLTTLLMTVEHHTLVIEGINVPCICLCDRRRIERVVANILSNAVKYSPAGGEIRVSLAVAFDEQGEWAEIAVADQGIGIPEDEMDQIFTPFYRASNGSGIVQGTGLGLASARQVVAQHGGTLTVTSTQGKGSVFWLRLPRNAPEPETKSIGE